MSYARSEGISGLDGLMSLFGGLVGAIVGMVIALPFVALIGVFKVGSLAYGKLKQRREAFAAANPVSFDSAPTTDTIETIQATVMPIRASGMFHPTDGATRRRVELGKAHVDIWFYPSMGTARRTMRITNKQLAKKLGSRIKLPELSYSEGDSQEVMELKTIEEAENLLNERRIVTRKEEAKAPIQSRATPNAIQENQTAKEPTPVVEKAQPRKKEVVYCGQLERSGTERFGEGEGAYECFAVSIFDFKLGASHTIKGADLARALKEAGVKNGDAIEVSLSGETDVFIKGKRRPKKIWNVTKLAAN